MGKRGKHFKKLLVSDRLEFPKPSKPHEFPLDIPIKSLLSCRLWIQLDSLDTKESLAEPFFWCRVGFLPLGHEKSASRLTHLDLAGLVNIHKAIEHGPVEIADLPSYKTVIFHSCLYVYQMVVLKHVENPMR